MLAQFDVSCIFHTTSDQNVKSRPQVRPLVVYCRLVSTLCLAVLVCVLTHGFLVGIGPVLVARSIYSKVGLSRPLVGYGWSSHSLYVNPFARKF